MKPSDIPLESAIKDKIMAYLKTLRPRGWFFKTFGSAFQAKGLPDIIGVYDGRFVALEVKRPRVGRVTALQQATINHINAAGGVACIVTSVDEAREIIGRLGDQT